MNKALQLWFLPSYDHMLKLEWNSGVTVNAAEKHVLGLPAICASDEIQMQIPNSQL
jgi:hypothetical protein